MLAKGVDNPQIQPSNIIIAHFQMKHFNCNSTHNVKKQLYI